MNFLQIFVEYGLALTDVRRRISRLRQRLRRWSRYKKLTLSELIVAKRDHPLIREFLSLIAKRSDILRIAAQKFNSMAVLSGRSLHNYYGGRHQPDYVAGMHAYNTRVPETPKPASRDRESQADLLARLESQLEETRARLNRETGKVSDYLELREQIKELAASNAALSAAVQDGKRKLEVAESALREEMAVNSELQVRVEELELKSAPEISGTAESKHEVFVNNGPGPLITPFGTYYGAKMFLGKDRISFELIGREHNIKARLVDPAETVSQTHLALKNSRTILNRAIEFVDRIGVLAMPLLDYRDTPLTNDEANERILNFVEVVNDGMAFKKKYYTAIKKIEAFHEGLSKGQILSLLLDSDVHFVGKGGTDE
jgi:hypothetical protein